MKVVKTLPQKIDIEEFLYRISLTKGIAEGEEDIRKGRVIPHEKIVKEINRCLRYYGLAELKKT